MTNAPLLANVALAWLLTGLIWTIQLVHYPLFGAVGADQFVAYHAHHSARITWLVGPVMTAELAAAAWLVTSRPMGMAAGAAWLAAVLVALVWLSTGLLQVPLHVRLGGGQDLRLVQRLVATNWVRTVAWTVRALLLTWWMARGPSA
jgi:hypothetical protein